MSIQNPSPNGNTQPYFLRDDWHMLNNGSFGACPRPVFEVWQNWRTECERYPDEFFRERLTPAMDAARAKLAAYLHTTSDQIAFVTNATMGVNVASHSLRSQLQPGDEVLTTNHEYGACEHAWQFMCRKTGAKYIQQPIPVPLYSQQQFLDALWAGVTPRTKVIYLSHTTSPTALTFPIKAVCARAREAGILTVIDGAHVPGQRDLDLDDMGADFYTGNCHKWMCSPKGTAFIYARKAVQHLIEPLIVGWRWLPDETSAQPMVDYVEQFGTRDMSGFLAVPAAIDYMAARNWPAVRTRSFMMVSEARARIEDVLDTESLCPTDTEWFSQMVSIRLPNQADVAKLAQTLYKEHRISVPVMTWNGVNLLRLSVQEYTSQAQVDKLVEVVVSIVKEANHGQG
jgi:isopenicillin-N epimerase